MRDRIILGSVAFGVVAFAAFTVALYVTDQQLAAQLAHYEPPPEVTAHEHLAREVRARVEGQQIEATPSSSNDLLGRYVTGTLLLAQLRIEMEAFLSEWHDVWSACTDVSSDYAFYASRRVGVSSHGEQSDRLSALLTAAEGLLEGLRTLAEHTFVAFPPDVALESEARDFFIHSAQLLSFGASFNVYRNQPDGAYKDIVAGLKISNTMRAEPTAAAQDIGWWMADTMCWAIALTLDPGRLSPELAEELAEQCTTREAGLGTWLLAASAQIGALPAGRERWRQTRFSEYVDMQGVYWGTRSWIWDRNVCRPLTNLDDRELLEIAKRIEDIPEGSYHAIQSHLNEIADYADSLPTVCWSSKKLVMPSLVRDASYMARVKARLDITRLGLLIERHHTLHGAFPAALSEIDGIEEPLPVDPFTGESYHYLLYGPEFLLYSPGEDGVDDDVQHAVKKAAGEAVSSRAGREIDDIVWRLGNILRSATGGSGEFRPTGDRPELIEKQMIVAGKDNRPPVTGFAVYASNDASVLMHCYGWEDYSDGYDDYGIEISRDNGKTWSEWTIKWKSFTTPEGRVRYAEPAAYWDTDAEQLIVLIDKSLYPNDTLTHQTQYQIVEYIYDPRTNTWSEERPLDFGSKSIAVSFSFPIKTARGVIMVPAMRGLLDADGNIVVDERSGTPVHESITIRGIRNADGRIDWSLGAPIPVDRAAMTRGMDENTYAELADGRVAALIRASNAGAPELPGYKWLSFTRDDGLTWSKPVPMPADKGEPIESGANGSALFRSIKNGKLYWIGNLCRDGERPNGNRPRHTLMLVEVQEEPFAFKRDSIFIIDEQEPDDTPALQISNFRYYQDRATGDLVLFAPRLGAHGRDWRQSDYYRYRVAMPDATDAMRKAPSQ